MQSISRQKTLRLWGLLSAAALTSGCTGSISSTDADGHVNVDGGTGADRGDVRVSSDARDAMIVHDSQPFDGGPPPPPGCGLTSAAFCEDFEEGPSHAGGRTGEFDPTRWSVGRFRPQLPTNPGGAIWIGQSAYVDACRSDRDGTQVLPDDDSLVCDPQPAISSHFGWTSTAAQNYGLNSYRIRQPFDFSGRTGIIAFDADVTRSAAGIGFISVDISQDPTAGASFARDEKGIGPQNGVIMAISRGDCNGHDVGIWGVNSYRNFVETWYPGESQCITSSAGHLNHFEFHISSSHLEVFASDPSTDGRNFPNLHSILSMNLDVPIERGYVNFTSHNHATMKYSFGAAWVTRWDNIAFDGPVIPAAREYSAPDSLVSSPSMSFGCNGTGSCVWSGFGTFCDMSQACNVPVEGRYVGYVLTNATTLTFNNVDVTGMTTARLAFITWYLNSSTIAQYTLHYRFNGGTWHDRLLTTDEIAAYTRTDVTLEGGINQIIDVPVSDLRSGDNTLEIVAQNTPTNYPTAIVNVDLILH